MQVFHLPLVNGDLSVLPADHLDKLRAVALSLLALIRIDRDLAFRLFHPFLVLLSGIFLVFELFRQYPDLVFEQEQFFSGQ